MRSLTISARDRRVLVFGIASIALVFAVARGLPAWRQWYAETSAFAGQLRGELARAQVSMHRAGVTRDSLAVRKRRLMALLPLLVSGDTPQMAGASLASMLASAATTAGVRLGTVQVRPDSLGRAVFTRVAVRAEVIGDVRGLTAFLSAVERDATLLAVRELSVSQPEPAAPPERAEALRVELTVEGLALTPPRARKLERVRSAP